MEKTAHHCDIYPDILQLWRRIHDQNPHFIGDMPLAAIKMDTINEAGAVRHREHQHLVRRRLNIQHLHKQDTPIDLTSGFGGQVVSMLASGTQDCGFKPGRSRRIFFGRKKS
jgi:hypothetical protein